MQSLKICDVDVIALMKKNEIFISVGEILHLKTQTQLWSLQESPGSVLSKFSCM